MRIGELSRHVGVSTHVLRAWESRYGLLRPIRSPGGYRLYGPGDARRVLAVLALREEGVSAAEACRTVLRQERRPAPDTLSMRLPRILPDGTVAPDEGGSHVNGDGPNRLAEDLAEVMDCLQDFDESGARWSSTDSSTHSASRSSSPTPSCPPSRTSGAAGPPVS